MRMLTVCLLALVMLAGCSSRNIIEMNEQNTPALQNIGTYDVLPVAVEFKPPVAWEIDPDEWKAWVDLWRVDFRRELEQECLKTVRFVDTEEEAKGAWVRCTVYEMDKGGFSGFGGNGFARAQVVVTDQDGKIIYDARLEGTGANSGFESAVAQGRLKFAILNLARQIADVLDNG